MSLNTAICPKLCIYMRFFSYHKGHSKVSPCRISKEMKTCVPGRSVRLLLLENWAKVRLRREIWAFWARISWYVAGLKDETHLLRWVLVAVNCQYDLVAMLGKETGALPTQNQPGQEMLNVAQFHLFFLMMGWKKKFCSLLNKVSGV